MQNNFCSKEEAACPSHVHLLPPRPWRWGICQFKDRQLHRGTTWDVKCWSYEIWKFDGHIILHNEILCSLWAIAGHRPAAMNKSKVLLKMSDPVFNFQNKVTIVCEFLAEKPSLTTVARNYDLNKEEMNMQINKAISSSFTCTQWTRSETTYKCRCNVELRDFFLKKANSVCLYCCRLPRQLIFPIQLYHNFFF